MKTLDSFQLFNAGNLQKKAVVEVAWNTTHTKFSSAVLAILNTKAV